MQIEVTNEEAAILAQVRDLLSDEMLSSGIISSASRKIEYGDGHLIEITWHAEDPDA